MLTAWHGHERSSDSWPVEYWVLSESPHWLKEASVSIKCVAQLAVKRCTSCNRRVCNWTWYMFNDVACSWCVQTAWVFEDSGVLQARDVRIKGNLCWLQKWQTFISIFILESFTNEVSYTLLDFGDFIRKSRFPAQVLRSQLIKVKSPGHQMVSSQQHSPPVTQRPFGQFSSPPVTNLRFECINGSS